MYIGLTLCRGSNSVEVRLLASITLSAVLVSELILLPLWARTGLPLLFTQVAELHLAPASHVVATPVQLDHGLATRTPRPSRPFAELQGFYIFHVFVAPVVHAFLDLELAPHARYCTTFWVRTFQPRGIHRQPRAVVLHTEEPATGGLGTIDALLGAELPPLLLEAGESGGREVFPDRGQWDPFATACGGKQRLVLGGRVEEIVNAVVVVIVAAWCADLGPVNSLHASDAFLGQSGSVHQHEHAGV